jgi:DNA-binding NarL/FixJ family response regulator
VVGEARDGRGAVEAAQRLDPDVAVLDLAMEGMGGLEAARLIRETSPATRVVVLTVYESPEVLQRAVAAGAHGFVAKSDVSRTLLAAVGAAARGISFVTPRVAGLASTRPLTGREREVLQLLAEGLTTREVADRLGIRAKTVETHRASLRHKLRLHGFAELVRYAVRSGLVEAGHGPLAAATKERRRPPHG